MTRFLILASLVLALFGFVPTASAQAVWSEATIIYTFADGDAVSKAACRSRIYGDRWYKDEDGDGYGSGRKYFIRPFPGAVNCNGDDNDYDSAVNPRATRIAAEITSQALALSSTSAPATTPAPTPISTDAQILAKLDSALGRLEQTNERLTGLEGQLTARDRKILKLERQVGDLIDGNTNLFASVKDLNTEIETQTGRADRAEAEVARLTGELTTATARIGELEQNKQIIEGERNLAREDASFYKGLAYAFGAATLAALIGFICWLILARRSNNPNPVDVKLPVPDLGPQLAAAKATLEEVKTLRDEAVAAAAKVEEAKMGCQDIAQAILKVTEAPKGFGGIRLEPSSPVPPPVDEENDAPVVATLPPLAERADVDNDPEVDFPPPVREEDESLRTVPPSLVPEGEAWSAFLPPLSGWDRPDGRMNLEPETTAPPHDNGADLVEPLALPFAADDTGRSPCALDPGDNVRVLRISNGTASKATPSASDEDQRWPRGRLKADFP